MTPTAIPQPSAVGLPSPPQDPADVVTDPTVTADYVFSVPHEPKALEGLALQLHGAASEYRATVGLARSPSIDLDPDGVEQSHPLDSFDRRRRADGTEVDLAIRQVQDTVWVQIGSLRTGTYPLDQLPPLKPIEPGALKEQKLNEYLGLVLRYTVEFEPGLPPEAVRLIADRAAGQYFGGGSWDAFPTANGVLLLRLRGTVAHAVLAYPRGADVTHDLHFTLPFLATCHFKLERVKRNQKQYVTDTRAWDRKLKALLDCRPARRLGDLQRRTDEISALVEQLADRVALMQAGFLTLKVNREIVNQLLAESALFRAAPGLAGALVETSARQLQSRGENEIGYRQATLDRARVHLANVDATIDLEQARQNQKLTLVLLALTCVQAFATLPQLFAKGSSWDYDGWSTGARLGALGASIVITIGVWFGWIRRSR